ncbi:MAG: hypothetical protein WA190_15410 [Usitatibacter sp.]
MTFAILVLELALIRWLVTQVRVASYFANLVLLAAFLGMGLGVGLGRYSARLARWSLPVLAVVCVLLSTAQPLGFIHVQFPDLAPTDWGVKEGGQFLQFAGAALLVTACFWAVAAVFLFPGTLVGELFGKIPPLRAYAADLGGSLAGVLAMAALAALWLPPPVWFVLGALPLLWLFRDRWSVLAAVVAVAAATYSMQGATFSPYNRIDLTPRVDPGYGTPASGSVEWLLNANRDYYQRMLDLRPSPSGEAKARTDARRAYELPFSFSERPGRSAVVVGAGTGNDVSAALRRGFSRVVSIDIDPAILKAGQDLHPEQPYSDPRAFRINDDARAYFGRDDGEKFDVVCYGLLDSHALFSSMSSLRLDNFVFTKEGIGAAWARVRPDGVLSISFTVGGEWIYARMVGLVREATHLQPFVVPHGYDGGATILAGRGLTIEQMRDRAPNAFMEKGTATSIALPSDDWPFLYLRTVGVPWTYITVFLLVGLSAALAVRGVFGATMFSRARFDGQMFLLGAGFMLLETRAVTQLSLLFGSTWVVNTSVFGGVLLMILAANAVAARLRVYRRPPWYALLGMSLIAIWMLPLQPFFALDVGFRAALAGPIMAVPIFFAGIIFSSELRSREDAAASLGSNLCGAVVGGLLENLSMLVGLKAIVLLALAFYLFSMFVAMRRKVPGVATLQS